MGKQMSKGGMRSTRRQRSQVMSQPQPNVVATPEPPRLVSDTTDHAILKLKLQRDELMIYKGSANTLLRKEDETVKKLLKEGKTERAKLLLKKKRFQELILEETEKRLNSILNQPNPQTALPETRQEVDDTIAHNGEEMKRLHILLTVGNVEWMLKETPEGSKKQAELSRLLQLTNMGERELLEKAVEEEMEKLSLALGVPNPQLESPKEELEETLESSPATIDAKDDDAPKEYENELEELVVEKVKENEESEQHVSDEVTDAQPDPVIGQQDDVQVSPENAIIQEDSRKPSEASEPSAAVAGVLNEVVSNTLSSASEMTTATNAADADDEKSSPSESPSEAPLNTESGEISNLLPDVPTHPIDTENSEVLERQATQQRPDVIALPDAENV